MIHCTIQTAGYQTLSYIADGTANDFNPKRVQFDRIIKTIDSYNFDPANLHEH